MNKTSTQVEFYWVKDGVYIMYGPSIVCTRFQIINPESRVIDHALKEQLEDENVN